MSFVIDHIRRIDGQFDRLQLSSSTISENTASSSAIPSARVANLQSIIKSLSVAPSARNPLLSPRQIHRYISQAKLVPTESTATVDGESDESVQTSEYEQELEWLLVSKATTQIYGHILNHMLEETVAIANDIFYWDDVLSSQRYTALYSIQTSPLRLYDWGSAVWADVKRRSGQFDISTVGGNAQETIGTQWKRFYSLVREVVRERGVMEMHKRVVGPVARIRSEVRKKQDKLKMGRLRGANALGVLLGEGLMNESMHGDGLATPAGDHSGHKWKTSVARNIALIDAVLAKVNEQDLSVDKFDAAIAAETDDDPLYEAQVLGDAEGVDISVNPGQVAERLIRTLTIRLPDYSASTKAVMDQHGRPSRLVRYWLPITIAVLSSSTVIRILVNRKAEIITWIEEFGGTVMDFWANWVVEPTRKVIGTIRHDEGSEVSIMSKRSLQGDRDSLERMVVDFAVDNPGNATDTGSPLTQTEIAEIRAKVREGDLTPVLKAYEKDLASPFMGTVRGNLIRALLIQVQKTKVDVEVAMGGIDALLKSQELVFGFIGLTPGILVTIVLGRWLNSTFTRRKGSETAQEQGILVHQLRNIDRVLSNSTPTEFGELYYKDHGLLLCEVHVLRQEAKKTMPDTVYREFLEDMEELVDVRTGVKRQMKVVERIRWGYARFL